MGLYKAFGANETKDCNRNHDSRWVPTFSTFWNQSLKVNKHEIVINNNRLIIIIAIRCIIYDEM